MNKRRSRRGTEPKQVEIEIDWDGAWITPDTIRCLKRALTAETTSIRIGDLHAAQVRTSPTRFFAVGEGRLFTWRGLLPRAIAALQQAAYRVQIQDLRDLGCFQVDDTLLDEVDQRDPELLTSIVQYREGHVVVENPAEIPRLIALVCGLFAELPILIPVRHRDAATRLHRKLSRVLSVPVDLILDGRWKWAGQIAVCSHVSQRWYPFCRRPHLVLYPSRLDATPLRRDDRSLTWQFAFHLAFIADGERLSQFDRLQLEGNTGRQIHRYPRSPRPARTVKVLPVSWSGERPRPRLDAYQRKRQCIWNCDPRNQTLATLAQALHGKDIATLRQLGLLLPEDADLFGPDRELTVAILVEAPEHAKQLHRLLPDCRLQTAIPFPADRLPEIDWSRNDLCITTFVVAERSGLAADVVIRADGTATPWRSPWGQGSPTPFNMH